VPDPGGGLAEEGLGDGALDGPGRHRGGARLGGGSCRTAECVARQAREPTR